MSDIVQAQSGSLVDLESGAVLDMASRLAAMRNKLDIVQQFFQEIMVPEVDYGTIPGTPKPTLYKPGAEKLCELYGYTIEVANKREERDFKTGFYLAELTIRLRQRSSGQVIAEGVGEANVYEAKYRWRWVYERELPKGMDPAALVSKEFENRTTGDHWVKYRIENSDLFDQWNTVLKMAKKRALVDATLSATRSSGVFSQSEDDFEAYIEGDNDGSNSSPQDNRGRNGKSKASAAMDPKDLSVTVNFGQFKGKTLGEILDEKPDYIKWLADKAQAEKVRNAAANIIKAMEGQAPPQASPAQNNPQPPSDHDGNNIPTGDEGTDLDALFGGDPQ